MGGRKGRKGEKDRKDGDEKRIERRKGRGGLAPTVLSKSRHLRHGRPTDGKQVWHLFTSASG